MTEPTIRLATSDADRTACCDIAREAFGATRPTLASRAARLGSVLRVGADWWLLEDEDGPAATLTCYPLELGTPDGRRWPAHGVGAVATVPSRRGRGHASRLVRASAEHEEGRGRDVALLYSAIAPEFYERLGYRTCPAYSHGCERLSDLAASGPRAELVALDPRRSADRLRAVYERAHPGLRLARDAARWDRTLAIEPSTWWFGLEASSGELIGYARVHHEDGALEIVELLLDDPDDQPAVLRALAELARELGCASAWGWIARSDFVAEWFVDHGRAKTQPMVRGAADATGAQFWSSDYF